MLVTNSSTGMMYLFNGKNEILNKKIDGKIKKAFLDKITVTKKSFRLISFLSEFAEPMSLISIIFHFAFSFNISLPFYADFA